MVANPLCPPGHSHGRRQGQAREHRVLPHRAGHRHRQARPEQVRHQQDHGRDLRAEGGSNVHKTHKESSDDL